MNTNNIIQLIMRFRRRSHDEDRVAPLIKLTLSLQASITIPSSVLTCNKQAAIISGDTGLTPCPSPTGRAGLGCQPSPARSGNREGYGGGLEPAVPGTHSLLKWTPAGGENPAINERLAYWYPPPPLPVHCAALTANMAEGTCGRDEEMIPPLCPVPALTANSLPPSLPPSLLHSTCTIARTPSGLTSSR